MTAREVFSFPDRVDEISARLVAAGVVLMALVTIVFEQRWLTIVLAYGFLARVVSGPTLSPLGQLATRVVRPRLPVAARVVSGAPKRFAQAIGLVFTVTAVVLTYVAGGFDAARWVLGALAAAASLEAFAGLCIGCKIYGVLIRAGLFREESCPECAAVPHQVTPERLPHLVHH